MNALQYKMLHAINLLHSLASWCSPCHEDNTPRPLLSNEVDDPLCESFPASIGVRIGLVGANCKASIQHKNTTVCPLREETSSVWRWLERGVVLLESDVHVLERWRGRSRRSNGECQSVGLIIVVIRVLTHDYNLDIAEGSMAGPIDNMLDIIGLS